MKTTLNTSKIITLLAVLLILTQSGGFAQSAENAGGTAGELSPSTQSNSLPEGTIRRGTFANRTLITDAARYIAAAMHVPLRDLQIQPYVISAPAGEEHAKTWQELWIVDSPNGKGRKTIHVSFKETPEIGGADFMIPASDLF
jgi:hypothetical protein